jgi:RecA-family ATPase
MKYTPRLHVETVETRLPETVHAYLQNGAAKGQRNATLYSMSQQFFAAGISQAEAQRQLLPRALKDGLREAESITAIMSGYKSTVVTDPIKSRRTVSYSVAPALVHKDDFIQALQAAFLPDELVAVCDARWQEDRWVPDAAMIKSRTQWEKHHSKRPIDLICSTGGGAYIGINPLSTLQGGRKNDNIHAYRHVLAEFDDGDPEEQRRALETSGLPITLIVTSGKRSIHGWIRVDAANKQEWDDRRDQIFAQLKCDPKNNDPARVSRCPGVLREVDGVRVLQALLATQIGPGEWPEPNPLPKLLNVKTLRQSVAFGDGLPDMITGLLSVRSKMMIAGPSKARKSWTLLDLALSIASGAPWLGLPCTQGKVIFIDGELHKEQILDRLMTVSESRLLPEDTWSDNLMIWPMRGQMREVTELMHALMDTLLEERPLAIILDPIYKLLGDRDENAAGEINSLLNELEQVARNVGCCILYSHHFAKGDSSEKSPIDRASGSGVWARDPDAMVFFTPPPRPKKGEAPAAYDFDVNLVARGHPPTDPFAVKWNVGHFERMNYKVQFALKSAKKRGTYDGSIVDGTGKILQSLPPMSKLAAIEWLKNKAEISYEHAVTAWDALRQTNRGIIVYNDQTKMWQGTGYGVIEQ